MTPQQSPQTDQVTTEQARTFIRRTDEVAAITSVPPKPRRVLTIGRVMMVMAGLGMITSTLIAYPLADRFSLGMQIAGHLTLPVSAAFFKLGYVVRLAAHHALGNRQAG